MSSLPIAPLSRRAWFRTAAAGTAAAVAATMLAGDGWAASLDGLAGRTAPTITLYKSPSCGCCKLWVDHAKASGFAVNVQDVADLSPVKQRFGIPNRLQSCHTGLVGGYVVEGHVPADLVHRLLKEKPDVLGIAVPGMPIGSPGMEGGTPERYEVLTFDRTGKTTVFARR